MAVATHTSADGVVGVISLTHPGCTIEVEPTSLRLLTAAGQLLPIGLSAGNPVNPAGSKRPDVAEYSGRVRLGFAWSGTYCGGAGPQLQVRVNGHAVRAVLGGPLPGCRSPGASTVTPGVIAQPGAPVGPAPQAWRALRARVILPATVDQGPVPLKVVFTNSGRQPVSLADPCPVYNGAVQVSAGGFASLHGLGGDLCARALTVQPGRPLTLDLGTVAFPAFSDTPRTIVRRGDRVQLTWQMAGVATTTATAVIR